jgi:hypothetical protein
MDGMIQHKMAHKVVGTAGGEDEGNWEEVGEN